MTDHKNQALTLSISARYLYEAALIAYYAPVHTSTFVVEARRLRDVLNSMDLGDEDTTLAGDIKTQKYVVTQNWQTISGQK